MKRPTSKRSCWREYAEFFRDGNAPPRFAFPEIAERTFGSMGVPPDVALMNKEPVNRLDQMADAMGWDGERRLIENWLANQLVPIQRRQWIENSLREGHCLPLASLTLAERSYFLAEWQRRRKQKT